MFRQRAAIIGAGFMGDTHAEMLHRLGVKVHGVLGATEEESEAAAVRYQTHCWYKNIHELMEDEDVNAIHICTPNHLHAKIAMMSLEAGKHVICEKPLGISKDETAKLVKELEKRELVGAVNYNLRYYPLCHEARHRIQAGEIGEVRLVQGRYLQDWLLLETDWNWRLDTELGGNSCVVADIGMHWFDMVTWLTGLQVNRVQADLATVIRKRYKPEKSENTFTQRDLLEKGEEVVVETEDYAAILMRLDNDVPGSLTLSQVSAGHKNLFEWEINGSKASLCWQQENPNELWIGHRDRANEILVKDPSLFRRSGDSTADFPGGHAEGYPDTFKQLFKTVYSYIDKGDFSAPRTFPTFAEGHREVVLTEAVLESAKEQRWLDLSSFD